MAYKGNHRETPQNAHNAQKLAKAAKAAEARNRTYTVNDGVPVVPVHFTGFSKYRTNGTYSAN